VPGDRAAAVTPPVLGRDRELAQIASLLRAAADAPLSAAIRIVGTSGYGKSALLRDALDEAARAGWIVFDARCYAGQRRTPGAALRRLVRDGMHLLGDSIGRYASGLELELTSPTTPAGRFELAFVRLMEGLLVDYRCVLAFDDAQWLDQQTATALRDLVESASARPLAIVVAERPGPEPTTLRADTALAVTLDPLATDVCDAVVRRAWPAVPPDVATAIVDRAGGVPFDLVALAQQARSDGVATPSDVSATAHAVLRAKILTLPPDQREFLQLCTLIRDPIDLRIVRRLISDESQLDDLIAQSDGYVELDGATLRFRHALLAEAAHSTISAPLSLRRRILTAYTSSATTLPGDYDRIAALAAEVGDTETEFNALVALGTASWAQEVYDAAVVAFRRALSVRRPAADDFVAIVNQYTIALRILARWDEAHRVLEDAVDEGIAKGIPAIGLLASALLYVVWMQGDRETALSVFRELYHRITVAADRRDLIAEGAYLHAEEGDANAFEALRAEFDAFPEAPSRYAATTMHLGEATLMSRLGRFSEAVRALGIARQHVDRQRSVHKFSVDCYANHIAIKERGCAGPSVQLAWLEPREDGSLASQVPPLLVALYALQLGAIVDFARGNWEAALSKIESANLRGVAACPARTQLLGIVAAIAALTGQPTELADVIDADLRHAYERSLWKRALPLAFWWAAFVQLDRPRDAAALVDPLRHLLNYPMDSSTFYFPLARVLYAQRAKDAALLAELLDARHPSASPWDNAQDLLARGIANAVRGDRQGPRLLAAARDAFGSLEASFFEAYAAATLAGGTAAQRELLQSLGVIDPLGLPQRRRARTLRAMQPTQREREIAMLVAEGYTNRRVAERLTLSERTVEVHVANLFDKLNVTSRTQLVRRVLEAGYAI